MKIEVKRVSKEELESLGTQNWSTWGCDVSEFDWEYGDKETCYIKEGKVIVNSLNPLIQNLDILPYPIKDSLFEIVLCALIPAIRPCPAASS